jgi:quinoprotein glucose dehydrogenase
MMTRGRDGGPLSACKEALAMSFIRSRPFISGAAIAFLGLYFMVAGGWLISLGGSWYYALAGFGIVASGVLLAMGKRFGRTIYLVVWIGTVAWAFWEVGTDVFGLMPRLLAPTVLLAYVYTPWISRSLDGGGSRWGIAGAGLACLPLAGLVALALAAPKLEAQPAAAPAADAAEPTDWPEYGANAGGARYAPVGDITPDNVSNLEVAWTARTGDSADEAEQQHQREFHSEATPIKVGDTLYTCTPHSWVLAIDAVTGAVKWTWKLDAAREGNPYLVCRGVAYFEAPEATECRERVFAPTFDARVVALDAKTGRECQGFGDNGYVNLRANAGDSPPGYQITTSPPLVANGRMIVGSRIRDNRAVDEPSGVVRAYDPVTGREVWAWDVGRGPDAVPPLPPDQIYTRGTPNVWGAMTADPERGLVYLPLGNPTPDYFGGQRRPFDERFGSSITALEIATGKLRWTFQTVHHDVWDFDLPIGPTLVDLPDPNGSGTLPALVQTTKTGQVFMLNRETGKPIADIEERPVPQHGAAPGERLSPTQPFSVGMPSFTPPPLQEKDAWGATPIDQLICRIEFKQARHEGIYTPPGLTPMIGNPAFDGVTDWGGPAVDPRSKLMTVNLMSMPFKIRLIDRNSPEAAGARPIGSGEQPTSKEPVGEDASSVQHYPQFGTPYVAAVQAWLGPFGAPCAPPPWGELAAVDLKTRKIVWRVTLGTSRDTNLFGLKHNLPLPTGAPNLGGSVITAGGVAFIGATTDQYLRAFDLATGKELWKARLPAGAQATPMVYRGRDGRQYVVITAGGHGAIGARYGDYTIAFALPKQR